MTKRAFTPGLHPATFTVPAGYSEILLQLHDDEGRFTELVKVREHVCNPHFCESPAVCETCGATGAERIILIGSTDDGMDIFMCYFCQDDYAKTEREPSRCENPWHRTGETPGLRPCPECPPRLA